MKQQSFTPIYEGLFPYKTEIAILKDYGGRRKKLSYCNRVRQSGLEVAEPFDKSENKSGKNISSYTEKNTVNEEKLCNNLSRAKSTIQELALCNDWQYFFTATIDPTKYDREDLPKFRKDFTRFCREKHATKIDYLLIPERHANGGWHMHGFLSGIPPELLREFTLQECLPVALLKKLQQGKKIYDWSGYRNKFGFCVLEPVESPTAAAFYVTKYVTKDNSRNVQQMGGHLYYASQGLNRAKILKIGKMDVSAVKWDFENEYVKIKWYGFTEHPELLIQDDNTTRLLRQRRDAALGKEAQRDK